MPPQCGSRNWGVDARDELFRAPFLRGTEETPRPGACLLVSYEVDGVFGFCEDAECGWLYQGLSSTRGRGDLLDLVWNFKFILNHLEVLRIYFGLIEIRTFFLPQN